MLLCLFPYSILLLSPPSPPPPCPAPCLPSEPYCQCSHSGFPSPYLPILRSQENQLRAQQWMQKLRDQLELQHFLRDCHEVGMPAVLGTGISLPGRKVLQGRGAVGVGTPRLSGSSLEAWLPCACSVGPPPPNAGFGEGGRDPGSPWQRWCARPPCGTVRRSHLSSGDLQEARCCLQERGARDWRGLGSATSVTDGPETSLLPP